MKNRTEDIGEDEIRIIGEEPKTGFNRSDGRGYFRRNVWRSGCEV